MVSKDGTLLLNFWLSLVDDIIIPAQWESVGSGHKGGKLDDLRHPVRGPGPELKHDKL